MLKKHLILSLLLCLSTVIWAKNDPRYYPLASSDDFFADLNSIQPHPKNKNLITLNFITNVSDEEESEAFKNVSMVELQHINCSKGIVIHKADGLIKIYDKFYGEGKLVLNIPTEAVKTDVSKHLTPLKIFTALACHIANKPLLNNPNSLQDIEKELQNLKDD